MRIVRRLIALVALLCANAAQAERQVEPVFGTAPTPLTAERSGVIERHRDVPSAFVLPREVQVWLPPGYDRAPQRRYPVLYLHDGQHVFDALASGSEWQVDETALRLMSRGEVPPAIIVAVSNTTARFEDYTPVAMQRDGRPVGGGAARYGRFLVEELKPFIDRRYRTRREPAHTALGGSSLGGLVTLWLTLQYPQVFGAGLVVSPSVWWAGHAILRDVAAVPLAARRPRLWLSIGALEGEEAVFGARRLREALLARGWAGGALRYVEVPAASHDEVSWAAQVEGMLRFLWGRRR
jgi:predicted alpha/beta superfamily hydrolase